MDNYYSNPTFNFTSSMPLWYFLRAKAAHVCHEYGVSVGSQKRGWKKKERKPNLMIGTLPTQLGRTLAEAKDLFHLDLNEAVKDQYYEIRPGSPEMITEQGNLGTKNSGQAESLIRKGTRFIGKPTQEPTHWDGNGPRIRSPGFWASGKNSPLGR
ncbi:hypothetical protein N7540_004936 [Penicillium herquei]|nr:hypothetical protein N7540_004936 [Penicillium herquei]